jgi:polyribonucleotide nucleotidyltransferase
MVPNKKKKKPVATPDNNGVTIESDGSGRASATLEVGDFGPTLIGPGGSRIQSICEQSGGAKVDVDKASKTCVITGTEAQVAKAKELVMEVIGSHRKNVIELGAKRGLVFGAGGEGIRRIQTESGARLDLERGSSLLTISGKDSCVEAAAALVEAILRKSNVDSVPVAEKDRPTIIGKGGENIRKLQAESGAMIDLDGETSVCTITGDAAQVAKAKELIKLYIEHRGPPPEATETLTVTLDHGRLVIGKAGANVTALQAESKARFKVDHSGQTSLVTISGGAAEVAAGVKAVHKLIADHSVQATVALGGSNLVKAVIGEKGASIMAIRETSGARVEIAQDSSHVAITGTKQQVAKAKAMVEKKIADELGPPLVPSGQTQHHVDLGGATGKIIGASGANLERIQKEHHVQVTIKNGTMCYVTGPAAGVDAVRKEIDDVLSRHAEMLQRARKQEEELAKVAANSSRSPSDSTGGWDVPVLEGNWGNFTGGAVAPASAPAAQDPWGSVDKSAVASAW